MSTLTLPNTPDFRSLIDWLHDLARHQHIGMIRTPDGDDFVVMLPEQVAELDAVLSDPAFSTAIEAGASDVVHGRVEQVDAGRTLSDAIDKSPHGNATIAAAIEAGTNDILSNNVEELKGGQSLKELL